MEEVDGSNPSRSTNFLKHLASYAGKERLAGVQNLDAGYVIRERCRSDLSVRTHQNVGGLHIAMDDDSSARPDHHRQLASFCRETRKLLLRHGLTISRTIRPQTDFSGACESRSHKAVCAARCPGWFVIGSIYRPQLMQEQI